MAAAVLRAAADHLVGPNYYGEQGLACEELTISYGAALKDAGDCCRPAHFGLAAH